MFSNLILKYKQFATEYPRIDSAIHTFITSFAGTVIGALAAIPADKLTSPETWTYAFLVSILITGIRAGLRSITTK